MAVSIPKYLELVSCCNPTLIISIPVPIGFVLTDEVYAYVGSSIGNLEKGQCYTVTEKLGTSTGPLIDESDILPQTGCDDLKCGTCECYTLYPCEPGEIPINTRNLEFASYVGEFVSLIDYTGCWYVTLNESGFCENSINVELDIDTPCSCPATCYLITGNPTEITYLNIDEELITTSGSSQICSLIYPVVSGGSLEGAVYELGTCSTGECPEICFTLTDCNDNTNVIESNTQTLLNYVGDESVIKINGYDTCWIVDFKLTCECPIPVSVLQSYTTCSECLPVIAYKFTNCNNTTIVKYSTNDYSAYVGKSVQLECGDCWSVELINYTPPSTQPINIQFTFDNCTVCNRTYYELTDCLDPTGNKIYTYSDLSSYVDQVVKIKGCDSCFTVEETREPINAGIVNLTDSFIDCPECLDTFPCVCSTVTNINSQTQSYCYLDCNFEIHSIQLQPGETSDKICVIKWLDCPDTPCDCILASVNLEVNPDTPLYYNFEKTEEIYNGKPVYKACYLDLTNSDTCSEIKYADGCWYFYMTINDLTPRSCSQMYKLCSDTDCPLSEIGWVPVLCTSFSIYVNCKAPFSFNVYVTDPTISPYVYASDNDEYTLTYNSILSRWEIKDNGTLLGYYAGDICNPQLTDIVFVSVRELCSITGERICTTVYDNVTSLTTELCPQNCDCIELKLSYTIDGQVNDYIYTFVNSGDTQNGCPVYEGIIEEGQTVLIYFDGSQWIIKNVVYDEILYTGSDITGCCPTGTWDQPNVYTVITSTLCQDPIQPYVKPENAAQFDQYSIQNYGDCNSTGNICYNYVITVPAFNESQTVYYKNCEGVVSNETFPLLRQPFDFTICGVDGQTTSDIYTTASEVLTFEKTIICDQPIFTCPIAPLPKRKVKPGYSTPTCDIEKYEKITCKASEFYYKQVMRLRYGISNCCPEDEEKWLVKKDLIDLDALRDPDYICKPVTTCCNQPIGSCGCDCNTTLKTCNS